MKEESGIQLSDICKSFLLLILLFLLFLSFSTANEENSHKIVLYGYVCSRRD